MWDVVGTMCGQYEVVTAGNGRLAWKTGKDTNSPSWLHRGSRLVRGSPRPKSGRRPCSESLIRTLVQNPDRSIEINQHTAKVQGLDIAQLLLHFYQIVHLLPVGDARRTAFAVTAGLFKCSCIPWY